MVIHGELPNYNDMLAKAANPAPRKGTGKPLKGLVYQEWKSGICQKVALEAKAQFAKVPGRTIKKRMKIGTRHRMVDHRVKIIGKCAVVVRWYAKNRNVDPDNISHAIKYILDGLQMGGIIPNDGWKQIGNILHQFEVDPSHPRVEIHLMENYQLNLKIDSNG